MMVLAVDTMLAIRALVAGPPLDLRSSPPVMCRFMSPFVPLPGVALHRASEHGVSG
jgi:hypothetical protein